MELASKDIRFLKWVQAQNGLVETLLPRIPESIFTEEGKALRKDILLGKTTKIESEAASEEEAQEFLRQQVLGLLGREVGRAQKSGNTSNLNLYLGILEECESEFEQPPTFDYVQAVPKLRTFIPTGISSIDKEIQGLASGELGIIAMATGMGKSHLLVNFAVSSLVEGRSVHYITVADAGLDEIVTRIDTCVLQEPCPRDVTSETLAKRHQKALKSIAGKLWISDFTDSECSLERIRRVLAAHPADLAIVDHADDIVPPYGDPQATRHSLRTIYVSLKRMAVDLGVPLWTASQTAEYFRHSESASVEALAEAKVGKATSAAIVLCFTQERNQDSTITCTIAKARRSFIHRVFQIYVDYPSGQAW